MDAKIYLQSYGWKEGEALKQGGLKKPILVKHKKDTKGLGHDSNDAEAWWERLFDGQLKNLEVKNGSTGAVSFEQNSESVVKDVRKANSPLYRMFVKGTGLAGTVGKTKHTQIKSTKIDASKVYDAVTETLKGDEANKSEKNKKDKDVKDEKDSCKKKSKKDKKEKTDKNEAKKSKKIKSEKEEIETKERKKGKKSKKIKSDKRAKSNKEDGKIRTRTSSKSEKKRKRDDKTDKGDIPSKKKKKKSTTSD